MPPPAASASPRSSTPSIAAPSVIATAGSEVKRAFLRLAGADHVLDSRDLGFADAVRAITGGAGVDVVLNSLSGEAMEQSLSVLKPFGRFLELGKRDFYLNRRIHLRPLRQNISYFAIDVDQLPIQRPDLARALLAEVSAALREGAIRPLAHRTFPFAGDRRSLPPDAGLGPYRQAGAGAGNGNAGVRLRQRAGDDAARATAPIWSPAASAGFGFAAARWLAAARRRRRSRCSAGAARDTPGAAERVAELNALGAEVRLYAGDVADPASLAAVLDDIRRTQPPLRGVVHAASAIADGLAPSSTDATIADILRPKARRRDRPRPADPGRSDRAVPAVLLGDDAARRAGAGGLCRGQSGARSAGAAAAGRGPAGARGCLGADRGYRLSRRTAGNARRAGAPARRQADARRRRRWPALPAMLASGLAGGRLCRDQLERGAALPADPRRAAFRRYSGRWRLARRGDDTLIERLAGLEPEEALALLKTAVAEEAANILRLPAAGIDPLRPLSEMGMDSLMAVELRLALENRLRVDLPLMSLAEGTSVASIATRLANAVPTRPHASELVEPGRALRGGRRRAAGRGGRGGRPVRSDRGQVGSGGVNRWRRVAISSDCPRRPRRG